MSENNSNEQIQLLKYMLEDLRKVTLSGVDYLTKEQLFQSPIEGEFPIGAYMMHLAECDIFWLETLSGTEVPDDLKKKSYSDSWFDSGPDSNPPKVAPEVSEYLESMEMTRKLFLDYVSEMKDSELDESIILKRKSGDKNISKKWIIYHIIEHEAHTRGQIFMLIRKAGWNKL